jgi:hypothetical protein
VPPGKYAVEVRNVAQEAARNTGRPMFTVILGIIEGEMKGKTLRDNFALPQTVSDSKYGLQRFHAFLLALGITITKPQIRFDLDALNNRRCVADVYDDTMPPREGYAERTISKVSAYFPVGAGAGTNGASPNGTASAPAEPTPSATPEPAVIGVGAAEADAAGDELDELFAT